MLQKGVGNTSEKFEFRYCLCNQLLNLGLVQSVHREEWWSEPIQLFTAKRPVTEVKSKSEFLCVDFLPNKKFCVRE